MPNRTHVRRAGRIAFVALLLPVVPLLSSDIRADAASAGTRVYVAPSSIETDCSVDVSAELEAWFDEVPDGSVMELRRDGCYRIDEPVTLDERHDIVFRGRGATLRAFTEGDQDRRHFHIRGGSHIRVSNLTIIGANPHAGLSDEAWSSSHAFQHGFTLNGVQGAILDHVRVFDVYGDFVYIGPLDGTPSRNITISNSTFRRNGRQGICVASGEHITIVHNRISGVRWAMIDLEPMSTDWHVLDVLVKDNVLGTRRLTMLSAATRGDVDKVSFINNDVAGTLRTGVESRAEGVRYSHFLFENNTAGTKHVGRFAVMKFSRVDDIRVVDNEQRVADEALVGLSGSCHVRVNRNTIDGAAEAINADDSSCDYSAKDNQT